MFCGVQGRIPPVLGFGIMVLAARGIAKTVKAKVP